MICPNCDNVIRDSELLKINATFMPGLDAPVEFTAGCPFCKNHIGKMSWGKFVPLEAIRRFNDRNRLRIYVCPDCSNDLSDFFRRMKGKEMPDEDVRCPKCQSIISKVVLGRYI